FVVDSNANTNEFKRGFIGDENIDIILPGETNIDNVLALQIGNEIFAQIKPKTVSTEGEIITSESVIVKNSLPEVENVKIVNITPRINDDLVLSWEFFDFEIDALGDLTQFNNTRVQWFKFNTMSSQFEEINTSISTSIETSSSTLSSSQTSLGDLWKAIVTSNDGLDDGVSMESNIVTII
ncbi:hypothetical protein LCGC14_2382160, partial [marine sediment metagenome]